MVFYILDDAMLVVVGVVVSYGGWKFLVKKLFKKVTKVVNRVGCDSIG